MDQIVDDIISFFKDNIENVILTTIIVILGNAAVTTLHTYWLIVPFALVYGVAYGVAAFKWAKNFSPEGILFNCCFFLGNFAYTLIVRDKRLLAAFIVATICAWFTYFIGCFLWDIWLHFRDDDEEEAVL